MKPQMFIESIEQIVTPVRASGMRKDRMREELAAHLVASWEEELERDGNEPAAAERAIRRLGDGVMLSSGLQESVPFLERWLFTPLPFLNCLDDLDFALRRKNSETPLRHAARIAIVMTAAIAALEMIAVPVASVIQARRCSDQPTAALFAAASLMFTAAGGILFTLLFEATIRALREASWLQMRVVVCMALASLFVIGLGLGFVSIVSLGGHPQALFAWSDWPRLLACSLIAPPMLASAARDERSRQRAQCGWGMARALKVTRVQG
ncbi:MAG TPA: hypothetical protein VG826_28750 [Pirellulales bacterium]|nr:hypothetical protein [Pirellulales bacterium]